MSTLTLDSVVPGTTLKVQDLCRTVRCPSGTVWQAGMITCWNGAWDRKSLVVSVTDMGLHPAPYGGGEKRLFHVVLRPLGRYYADHRFVVTAKPSKDVQLELWVAADETEPTGHIGKYMLCYPVGSQKPKLIQKKTPPTPYVPGVPKAMQPQFTPTPAATLESFRITKPGVNPSC